MTCRRFSCAILTIIGLAAHSVWAGQPQGSSTVALVLGQGQRAPSPLAEPMLIEALSKFPEVQLVEREAIRQVLDELKLNASGLVEPDKAIQFGKLTAADALVLIEKETIRIEGEAEPRPLLTRARLIETRTGIRLLDWFSGEEELKQGQAELVAELRRALGRLHTAEGGRHYVGVLGLRSEEPGEALIPTANALTALVEHDLGRLPSVVVLEREQLQRLTAERDLTGIELRLRASTMLLEGGLRRQGDAAKLSITLRLMPLAGGELRQQRITTAAGNLGEMRRAVVRAVQGELNVSGDDSQAGDHRKEAKIFADRAKCLLSHSFSRFSPTTFDERGQALSFAEAALALGPTVEHHDLAASACLRCSSLAWVRPSIDGLRYLHRGHQIDLAGTELRLCQGGPPQEEVKIGYQSFDRPSGRATIPYPLSITKVDQLLECLAPDAHEQRRLLLEINAMCKRKFEMLLELRRRGGATELELALLRLRHTWQLAADSDEFLEMIRTHVSVLDRQFATGGTNRASCEEYYEYLWEQLKENLLSHKMIAGRAGREREPRRPQPPLATMGPVFQWLAKHPDPATRIIGYLAVHELGETCELDDKDRVEGATRLLDVFFREIPKGQRPPIKESLAPVSEGSAVFLIEGDPIPTRKAAEILAGTGKLTEYLEVLLDRAERRNDATNLVRCVPATFGCVTQSDKSRDLLNRLVALIDAEAFDPRCAESAEYLRKRCAKQLASLGDRPEPPREIGPWVDYVIRPIPITNPNPLYQELVAVCIDRSRNARGDNPELALVWKGKPKSDPSGEAIMELLGCRMNIRGGSMREVGTCRPPRDFEASSIAAGGGAIFLGTRNHGLLMITAEGGRVFDESEGAPGAFITRLAWLDGQLYLALRGTIARFDADKRDFTILASSNSVQQRHPLDGGQFYEVMCLLSDPKLHCLWISISTLPRPVPGRNGIWRYTPATDTFRPAFEGSTLGLSWSDGTLFFLSIPPSATPRFSSMYDYNQYDYNQLDPESLAVRPQVGYQLRPGDAAGGPLRGLGGAGCVLVGRHIVAGGGRLYTPQGKNYHYDPARAALPSDKLSQLGEFDREIIERLGPGFVIVQYGKRGPPFLWYVEPREIKRDPGERKP